LLFRGENVTHLSCGQLRKRGFAYVPSDRLFRGVSLNSSVMENMVIDPSPPFTRFGFLKRRKIAEFTDHVKKSFAIKAHRDLPVGLASGGTIQKIVLARELCRREDLILFAEPTWGIDLGSVSLIYNEILKLRGEGVAILLISTDLDEVLTLSDRIAVLFQGRIVVVSANSGRLSKRLLGQYMLGIRNELGSDR
jgi:simple sugar transport system ATP-binding protein